MKHTWKQATGWILCTALLVGCTGNTPSQPENSTQTDTENVSESITQEIEEVIAVDPVHPTETTSLLPISEPLDLHFSSGVGAWSTSMTLNPDGTFSGTFHDLNMGGEADSQSIMYVCGFEGTFSNIHPIDKTSYALTLRELFTTYEDGKEWIEDDTLYISSPPYGIDEGTEFYFYLPNTPVVNLSEDLLSWWPLRLSSAEERPDTLSMYSLYNVDMGSGFFG